MRGRKKRIRGLKGYLSLCIHLFPQIVYTIAIASISAVLSVLATHLWPVKFYPWGQWLSLLLYLFLIFIIQGLGIKWALRKVDYHNRPLTDSEYEEYKTFNLIHYTDYLSLADIEAYKETGKISLIAQSNQDVNYSVQSEDVGKSFIWFHLSDAERSIEPEYRSFWFSHSTEGTPRAFKIVVPFTTLDRSKLQIRPMDGAITFEGDFNDYGTLFDTFEWDLKTRYLFNLQDWSPANFFLQAFSVYRQIKFKLSFTKITKELP
ncbi:hypothetical protein A8L34_28140 [Bacillus sp. FJAT-27264]|uniref:hypothetical protein n=1 Tax=Paenibacillus sp. (strain DSM 101736 / FJAT-27264) TaxID=1850362 RepID=UPI000807C6E4|nr:hypothetical protein [Bacillus sp. FJAT-27264]OBZ15919.1 hypothetical protein A8L34_28140 [Bacillus sp. FJAT-27264]